MSERQQQLNRLKQFMMKKSGTGGNRGYNDYGIPFPLGGRKRGSGFFQGNSGRRNPYYECGQYNVPSAFGTVPQFPQIQEQCGNMEMMGIQETPQIRHAPYNVFNKRRVKWHYESSIHVTVWREKKRLQRKLERSLEDGGILGNWFKITIPSGKKYDKEWLMNSIRRKCSVSFTPVDFHYAKNRAQFFVQNCTVASALRDVSYKISDNENQKICLFVNQSAAPFSVRNKLEPEQVAQIEQAVMKRYDSTRKSLDLQRFRFDPDLMGLTIDIILNRRNCMSATLQIIGKNCPELRSLNLCNNKLYQLDGLSDIIQKAPTIKILNLSRNELRSVWEVSKMKGLKLEELWLEGNPLCDTFPDKSTYISAIRDCFPRLLRLDGHELLMPVVVEADYHALIMPCKKCCKGSDVMKNLILQFLKEFYSIYDYGNRQDLVHTYHDNSCFSLSIPFNPEDPMLTCLYETYKESRNMKKLKDPFLRFQLLKHRKQDVVRSLCMLPKTQHDLSSLVVDMWFQTKTLLGFSVHGVFKELEGGSQGSIRAFSRTFVTTHEKHTSLCIKNDELFVRTATPSDTLNTCYMPLPATTPRSVCTLSQMQQEMVQSFPTQSGMNPQYSQKYLQNSG